MKSDRRLLVLAVLSTLPACAEAGVFPYLTPDASPDGGVELPERHAEVSPSAAAATPLPEWRSVRSDAVGPPEELAVADLSAPPEIVHEGEATGADVTDAVGAWRVTSAAAAADEVRDTLKWLTLLPEKTRQSWQPQLQDMAVTLSRQGQHGEVVAIYEWLAGQPGMQRISDLVRDAAANAYLAQHQPDRARDVFQALVDEHPAVQAWRRGLLFALVDGGHFNQAEAMLDAEAKPAAGAVSPRAMALSQAIDSRVRTEAVARAPVNAGVALAALDTERRLLRDVVLEDKDRFSAMMGLAALAATDGDRAQRDYWLDRGLEDLTPGRARKRKAPEMAAIRRAVTDALEGDTSMLAARFYPGSASPDARLRPYLEFGRQGNDAGLPLPARSRMALGVQSAGRDTLAELAVTGDSVAGWGLEGRLRWDFPVTAPTPAGDDGEAGTWQGLQSALSSWVPGGWRRALGNGGRGYPLLGGWNMDASLAPGYRVEDFRWNIAGSPAGPNILSELSWESLQVAQLKGTVALTHDSGLQLRGSLTQGRIVSGDNQDSDYLGDDRTLEFSRSNNDGGGDDLRDASVALGWAFHLSGRPWGYWRGGTSYLVPLVGYARHDLNLRMRDGNQTIPATGSFAGLNSTYRARWGGPWVGLEFVDEEPDDLHGFLRFEYHRARYEAEADWNLRTDFQHPVSYTHEADARGYVFSLGFYTPAAPRKFAWRLVLDYQNWKAESGLDRTFFSDGSVGTTRLNEVNRESWAISYGIQYNF